MRLTFLLLVLLLLGLLCDAPACFAQAEVRGELVNDRQSSTPLLGSGDLTTGNFALIVVSYGNEAVDEVPMVTYFDQPKALVQLQQALVGERPATQYPFYCPKTHYMIFVKDRELVDAFEVSEDCRSISSSAGNFYFSGYFPNEGYRLGRMQVDTYDSLEVMRASYRQYMTDPNLLYCLTEPWLDYDGRISFNMRLSQAGKEAAMKELSSMIQARYPNDPWKLSVSLKEGSSEAGWTFVVWVECKEDMAKRFSLPGATDQHFGGFAPIMYTYWRAD